MQDNIPGQIISPGDESSSLPQNQAISPSPDAVVQTPPIEQASITETQPPAPEFQVSTGFSAEIPEAQPTQQGSSELPSDVSWTASEYIAHHKSTGWYGILTAATLLLAVAVFFVTSRDIISTAVVIIAGIIFGVYAARKPQTQTYSISPVGVSIGQKIYPFTDLKSFAIVDEGAFSNITFMPLKRFLPAISIYYDPKDEDGIVAFLSFYLPIEQRRHDPIDRLMQRIRF